MAHFAARVTRTRSSGVAVPGGGAGHRFDAIRIDRAAARHETGTAPSNRGQAPPEVVCEGTVHPLSADFTAVRIHAGSSANQARSVNAAGGLPDSGDVRHGPGTFPQRPAGAGYRADREPAQAETDHRAWLSRLGPGRALDAPVRTVMESAFGHDFARVRIHDDSTAAALSRDLGARAFTVAEHVAFAEKGYRPGVPGGDRLLAHELAHVIQQSAGHAEASASLVTRSRSRASGDAALEADADRTADGVVQSLSLPAKQPGRHGPRLRGGVRLARDPAPPNAPAPGPATYDTGRYQIVSLPDRYTADDLESNLKQSKADGKITSWKPEGVDPGSSEYLYILYAIWQLSQKKSWDREIDLVTEIGPRKRGAITVRIDAGGNAVGVIVRRAEPIVAATYPTVVAAVAGLKAKYKLSDVTGEKNKQWSPADLNKVAAAFSRLHPDEAAALEGYSLIRTDDTLQAPDGKPAAGLTTTGNVPAKDQLSSIRTREIRFADRAFAGDSVSFVGDIKDAAPASTQTILHEVGHAQERKLSADADSAYVEAQVARNRDSGAADTEEEAVRSETKKALAGWAKLKGAQKTASKAFVDAFHAVSRAIEAMREAPDATKAEPLRQEARTAVAARDKRKGAVPDSNPALTLFGPALNAQDAYLAAAEALLSNRQAVETTKTRAEAASDRTGKRSARLQRFVEFVGKPRIKPIKPITQYAQDNWPAKPEEFYAEAFSIWRTDPKFLSSASPDLKKWFDDGEHLK
jgi:Domain of unknown function (DUF4157)